SESGVFDQCTSTITGGQGFGVQIYGPGPVYSRRNNPGVIPGGSPTPFALATDDAAYVTAAQANQQTGDPLADKMLRRLQPHADPRYGCGLLRHEDAQIRQAARQRLTDLGFAAALNPPPVDIPAALERIATRAADANELSLSILAMGPAARGALQQAAD